MRAEQIELIKCGIDSTETRRTDNPGREEKFKPRDRFIGEFYVGYENTIRTILDRAHSEGTDLVDFNRQTFDNDIDSYSKVDAQGKADRPFLNTVLMLELHKSLNNRSPHPPGHPVVGTPVRGYDDGNRTPDALVCAALFQYLPEQAQSKQIISMENTEHMQGFTPDESAHQISFTKKRDQGRYACLTDAMTWGRNSQMTNQPELSISHKPLWKLLIDKNLQRQDLPEMSGLSGAAIAKRGRNENFTTSVIVRNCEALSCQLHEVAELATTGEAGA